MRKYEELIDEWKATSWVDLDAVRDCLEDGMPAQMLYEALLWLVPQNFDNFEENMLELCSLLHKNGISAEDIQELLNVVDSTNIISWGYTFYRIVAYESEDWQEIGIDPTQYVERYLDFVRDYTDVESEFKELKDSSLEMFALASEALLKRLSMEKIIKRFDDPEYFIEACVYDSKAFGRKFEGEIGYKTDENLCDWMACILMDDPDALDVNMVISAMAGLEFGEERYYDDLKYIVDLDEEVLAPLKTNLT